MVNVLYIILYQELKQQSPKAAKTLEQRGSTTRIIPLRHVFLCGKLLADSNIRFLCYYSDNGEPIKILSRQEISETLIFKGEFMHACHRLALSRSFMTLNVGKKALFPGLPEMIKTAAAPERMLVLRQIKNQKL